MFFSKLERKILFLRPKSHEADLIITSNEFYLLLYFINVQFISSFISCCFELRDKLVSGIINPTDVWKQAMIIIFKIILNN